MEVIIEIMAFLLVIGLAREASVGDYLKIREHERIYHTRSWLFRAAGVIAVWYMASSGIGLKAAALNAIASAFLFSMLFRPTLNKLREKDWRYIAPWSNRYDRFFFTFMLGGIKNERVRKQMISDGDAIYSSRSDGFIMADQSAFSVENYRNRIHLAGELAGIVEGGLFLILFVLRCMSL